MPTPTTGTKTVFLVEDDVELARLTIERLEKEGLRVQHATNGEEACEKIQAEPPDLIILDIMLPGMDGFGVCRTIRPEYKGPILILTARDSDLDQILGLELGADDFVIKPIRPQVLLARIRALLRRAEPVKEEKVSSALTLRRYQGVVTTSLRIGCSPRVRPRCVPEARPRSSRSAH